MVFLNTRMVVATPALGDLPTSQPNPAQQHSMLAMARTRSGFTLKERIQSLTALDQVFLQGAFPALTFAGSDNKRTKPFAFADSFGKPICRAFVPL